MRLPPFSTRVPPVPEMLPDISPSAAVSVNDSPPRVTLPEPVRVVVVTPWDDEISSVPELRTALVEGKAPSDTIFSVAPVPMIVFPV